MPFYSRRNMSSVMSYTCLEVKKKKKKKKSPAQGTDPFIGNTTQLT